jgi:pyrrolidone-carboxylate peptidase
MPPVLVTGFGPFERFDSNPSEHLAKGSGLDHAVLEVSYEAVDRYLESLNPTKFESLVMMGLHGTATQMQLEMLAHNWIGSAKDVLGEAPTGSIQDGPPIRAGTLWRNLSLNSMLKSEPVCLSYHPGSYLCNYIYYRALSLFPEKRVGFLHVPSEKALPLSEQERTLKRLLGAVQKDC